MLRLSERYDDQKEAILFNSGLCLSQVQMEKGGFGLLSESVFRFASSMAAMEVDESEYSLLTTICLLSSGE